MSRTVDNSNVLMIASYLEESVADYQDGGAPWQASLVTAIALVLAQSVAKKEVFREELLNFSADFAKVAENSVELWEALYEDSSV